MIDSETSGPVAYQDFSVSIIIDGVDEPVYHGVTQTDEEGILEVALRSLYEEKGRGLYLIMVPKTITIC
ncbi:MAG: hypothetical protein WEA58_00850 [Balneolaceae bacterium]